MRVLKTEGSLFRTSKNDNLDSDGPYLLDTPKNKYAEEFINRSKIKRKYDPLEEFQQYLLGDKCQFSGGSDDDLSNYENVDLPFDKIKGHKHKKAKKITKSWPGISRKKTKGIQLKVQSPSWTKRISRQIWFQTIFQYLKPEQILFDPAGTFRISWDVFCVIMIFYEIIVLPFEIGFEVTVSDDIQTIIDVSFFFDILFNFNTGFYQGGDLVMDHEEIFHRYLRSWFWVDFFSTIPYSRFVESYVWSRRQSTVHSQFLRLIGFTRLIRVIRVIRIVKLKRLFVKLDEIVQMSATLAGMFSFIQLCFLILFCSHWLGCTFYFIGMEERDLGLSNWIEFYEINNDSLLHRYIYSLYWGVITLNTVGYGDITPQTYTERLCGIFMLIVACGLFQFSFQKIATSFQQIADRKTLENKKLDETQTLLMNYSTPTELFRKIVHFMQYMWENKEPMNLKKLCHGLPESLREQILIQVNGSIFVYCPVFCKMFSRKLLIRTCFILRETSVNPDEYVFKETGNDRSLYFIQFGEVKLLLLRSFKHLRDIKKGESFGLISFFSGQQRKASAQSTHFADLFYLDRYEFLDILREYPLEYEKFMNIQYQIQFQHDYSSLDIHCYSCKKDDHVIVDCPSLHYTVDVPLIISLQKKKQRLYHVQYIRSEKVLFNARALAPYQLRTQALIEESTRCMTENDTDLHYYDTDDESTYSRLMTVGVLKSRFDEERHFLRLLKQDLKIQNDKLYSLEEQERQTRSLQLKLATLIQNDELLENLMSITESKFKSEKRSLKRKSTREMSLSRMKGRRKGLIDLAIIEEESLKDTDLKSETGLDQLIDIRMNKIMKKYKAQKRYLHYHNNKNNEVFVDFNIQFVVKYHQESLQNFDKVCSFTVYDPQNNVENVVRRYNMIFLEKMQIHPTDEREYSEEVFEEFVNQFQLSYIDEVLFHVPTERLQTRQQLNLSYQQSLPRIRKKYLNQN